MSGGEATHRRQRFDQAGRLVLLSLAVNSLLMIVKMIVGRLGYSKAMFADGVENACDLAVSLATLAALRVCRQPLDRCHPYGHGRIESLIALLVGAIVVLTGGGIAWNALWHLGADRALRPTPAVVYVAGATVLVKLIMTRLTLRRARRLGSPLLRTLALDHRKDTLTSSAVLLGSGMASMGLVFLDPLVAVAAGISIVFIGAKTFRQAAGELLDVALPDEQLAAISRVAGAVEGVEGVHEIRGRRSGQYLIVDLKLDMDPHMTVAHSHRLATLVKQRLFDAFDDIGDVMIHINPHNDPLHEDLVRL